MPVALVQQDVQHPQRLPDVRNPLKLVPLAQLLQLLQLPQLPQLQQPVRLLAEKNGKLVTRFPEIDGEGNFFFAPWHTL